MKKYLALLAAALPILFIASCRDVGSDSPDNPVAPKNKEADVKQYVNIFAYNMMNTYYLWNEEMSSVIKSWQLTDDPFEKVAAARYKDSKGKDIDRWTTLTDDYKAFTSSVAGTSTTYGFEFLLYFYDKSKSTVCAVVTLVYADSPAAKAGLKRGDCIVKIGGKEMTTDNYSSVLNENFYVVSGTTLTMHGGSTVKMTPVEMYEDPVILYKTFDCQGKKVGYLLYNAFTQASYLRLIEACRYFKGEGVTELVLDLRYNGGGYTLTEQALASMLAPESDVTAKKVFETQVYNKKISDTMGKDETNFSTDFSVKIGGEIVTFSTADANIGLNKIYALMTSGSASASESLIGGLKPYIDVEIIGQQTHGKYCSGIIYSANEWYNDVKDDMDANEYINGVKYADNWGIYVMVGRYADKNGVTLCMPDGIEPDVKANDTPEDGIPLGDPKENLLSIALAHAGYVPEKTETAMRKASVSPALAPLPSDAQPRPASFGMKIDETKTLK